MLARLRLPGVATVVAAVVLIGLVCLPDGARGTPVPTVVVKNAHDSGPGSLREAVTNAVAGETIDVPAGHYRLTSGELSTDLSLQIVGAGARKTLIDGTNTSRILEDTSTSSTLYMSDLTVENANSHGGDGGAVDAAGALTLVRVAVVDNRAGANHAEGNGGGVEVSGKLTVRSSLIAHNYGYSGGGAEADSTLELVNSTIAENRAGSATAGDNGVSGAIETSDQPATVVNSTIAFNRCFNGTSCGGALLLQRRLHLQQQHHRGELWLPRQRSSPGEHWKSSLADKLRWTRSRPLHVGRLQPRRHRGLRPDQTV